MNKLSIKIVLSAIFLSTIVFVSSCKNDRDFMDSSTATKHSDARLNTDMTNEEMETDILDFLTKLDTTSVTEKLKVGFFKILFFVYCFVFIQNFDFVFFSLALIKFDTMPGEAGQSLNLI